ncbi:putative transcriptional regulator [Streptomyces chartreusis NRRL 3882]|uniref:Putative transcriptional regulator n=1 Tax=Streptomyces chartreusis NRRL 3882 TaxID=1079985 RepID=A0A2N9BEW6_STRCX|nr:putative transcriptional regulator [Streptomyces chartreusis NRRL 3882]
MFALGVVLAPGGAVAPGVVLKNGRAKAVRFSTLAALCEVLECQPGDLLRWEAGGAADGTMP